MSNIKVFEDKKIRTQWNEQEEDWYFSVVDIVGILTDKDYDDARKYWKVLKGRLKNEGSELVSFCYQLKLPAQDGKLRETDVLNTKGILRLVQSIPSKKAEPFKMWLSQVGSERLDEIADPEKAIIRGADFYRAKGYTEGWINQRLQTIEMRKELTDEWKARGIEKEKDYAILTNEMTKAWSGMSDSSYAGLYLGLNIGSSIGTIAGRLGMRVASTKTIGRNGVLKGSGQKPYSRITRGRNVYFFNGKGNAYWAIHDIGLNSQHWHTSLGRDNRHIYSYLEFLLRFIFKKW